MAKKLQQTHASEVFGEIGPSKPVSVMVDTTTAISPDHFEAIKAIGRIESALFLRNVADKIIAGEAIKMKEGKKYKDLTVKDENGNLRYIATFEDYCTTFLGKSYRRTKELMDNYNLLGPELYEQAEQMGFKQTDYNALKALSDDDKKTLEDTKTNAADIDKDHLIEVMESLVAKAIRDKEKLKEELKAATEKAVVDVETTKTQAEKDLADVKKNLDDQVMLTSIKEQKLNEYEIELARFREASQVTVTDWPEAFKGLLAQLDISRREFKYHLAIFDGIREAAMKQPAQLESGEDDNSLVQAREILATEMVSFFNECHTMLENLGLDFDKTLGAYSDQRINLFNFND